jgi:hypothetical protein
MKLKIAVAAGLVAVSGLAQAEVWHAARVGPSIGSYQQEFAFALRDIATGDTLIQGSGDVSELAYGAQLGFTAGIDSFFYDLGIEYQAVDSDEDDLDRTDILLTLGYLIDETWSGFAGYRRGMQGSGVLDNSTFNEEGWFVGAALRNIQIGAAYLGASLAYNFSEAQDFPLEGTDFDYGGLSIKVGLTPISRPQHSLQLRYQEFSGDSSDAVDTDGDGTPDVALDVQDLTERYIQLMYLYSF